MENESEFIQDVQLTLRTRLFEIEIHQSGLAMHAIQ